MRAVLFTVLIAFFAASVSADRPVPDADGNCPEGWEARGDRYKSFVFFIHYQKNPLFASSQAQTSDYAYLQQELSSFTLIRLKYLTID
ncbi:hypothetical protein A0J61_02420 [Choanephora cucurbitarum]|uniref:Uncharacterized protein n=1 Tax=Choanephora cucurbitarum TaxID=101091 RepID=A0A1C7NQH6_9FUNG|nr:hypothetical protein A0J61_02420 [Choanephora cucurbitarum]